jgi:hypothetical protein
MKFVSRSDLGWIPSPAADWPHADGVKVHYEGTAVNISDHDGCIQEWRDIRASHLANTKEGYVDIAYNLGACKHGYVLEGRGAGKKTGANGNQTLNGAHYSIVALLGDSGDTEPNDDMLHALRDGIEYLQGHGAGGEIRGHRDGYATSCPGDPLYRWVQAGAPRPGSPAPGPTPPAPSPAPTPNHPFPGVFVARGAKGDIVKTIQARLLARGWSIKVDSDFGPATDRVIRQFQSEKGLVSDGIVGPKTWAALWNAPIT